MEEHTHTDACYLVLVCDIDEVHEHDESCYAEPELLCLMPTDHEHGYSCYCEGETLICELEESEGTEEEPGHVHDSSCYDLELVCGIEEFHEHNATCYADAVLDCAETGHIHNEDCYIRAEEPQCGLEEHVHTEACLPQEGGSGGGSAVLPKEELDEEEEQAEEAAPPAEDEQECQLCKDHVMHGHASGSILSTSAPKLTSPGFMGIMATAGEEGDEYSSDLGDFVRMIEIFNSVGTLVYRKDFTDSSKDVVGALADGAEYDITITFMEKEHLQFEYNSDNYLTYMLPEEFVILENVTAKMLLGKNTGMIGEYNVYTTVQSNSGGSYNTEVKCYNVKDDGNPTPDGENFIEYYYDAQIMLNFKAKLVADHDDINFNFGDNATVNITVKEVVGKLEADKTFTRGFDRKTYTAEYAITFKASGGDIPVTHITDCMSAGWNSDDHLSTIFGPDLDTFQYDEFVTDLEVTLDGELIPFTADWATDKDKGIVIELTSPVIIKDGKTLVVTYTYDFSKIFEKYKQNGYLFDNVYPYAGALENVAQAFNSKDGYGDVRRRLDYRDGQFLTKDTASLEGDLSDNEYIRWVSDVGLPKLVDLGGITIYDKWSDGLTFNLDDENCEFIIVLNNQGGSEITSFMSKNYSSINDMKSALLDKGIDLEWTYEGSTIVGYSLTLPPTVDGGKGPEKVFHVSFDYTTKITNESITSFENEIWTSESDLHVTAKHQVHPRGLNISKDAEWILDDALGECIEWTVTVEIPESLYEKDLYFSDSMVGYFYNANLTGWGRDDPAIPMPNLTVTYTQNNIAMGELSVGYYPESGAGTYDMQCYMVGDSGWCLLFGYEPTSPLDNDRRERSKSPYNEDTVLTITYKTVLDEGTVPKTGGTIGDGLRNGPTSGSRPYLSNYFTLYYNNGTSPDSIPTSSDPVYWPVHKTGKVEGDRIDYEVRIDSKYYRTEDRDPGWPLELDSVIFTDVFDSRLEYVPYSFRIQRSGLGIPGYGPYKVEDEEVIDLIYENQEHFIKDYDTYKELTVDFDELSSLYSPNFGPTESNKKPSVWESPAEKGWYKVNINAPDKTAGDFVIRYSLRLKDDVIHLVDGQIENHVEIAGWYNDSVNTVTKKVVSKEMSAEDNIATVSIDINTSANKLIESADQFTITDTMKNMSFYEYSFNIYYRSKNNPGVWPGAGWETAGWSKADLNQELGEDWSYTISGANVIDILVPDETPIHIEYSALIHGAVGDDVDIENYVDIAGGYSDSVKSTFQISSTTGSGGGSRGEVTLIKEDANDSRKLKDAWFALYVNSAYVDNELAVPSDVKIAKSFPQGDETFYYIMEGTTDDSGSVCFDDQLLTMSYSFIYALVEIDAPTGYKLPDFPKTFFYLVNQPSEIFETLGLDEEDLKPGTDIIPITNEPYHAEVEIKGQKCISGTESTDEEFTFVLTEVDEFGVEIEDGYTDEATTTGADTFSFELDLPEGGPYYFLLTEKDDGTAGWTYDKAQYLFKIVVENGEAEIKYKKSSDDTPDWGAISEWKSYDDESGSTGDGDPDGLVWISPSSYPEDLPFGSANYFSALVFGNWSVQGADVESGLAVGGNLYAPNGYSLGKPYNYSGWPIAPHDPRLLVQGKLTTGSQLEVWGGQIAVSESSVVSGSPIRSMKYIGSKDYYNADDTTNFEEYPQSIIVEPDAKVAQFFSNAESDLENLSQYYKNLSGDRVKVVDLESKLNTHPAWINGSNYVEILYLDNTTGQGVFPMDDYLSYDTIVFNLTLNGFTGTQAELRSIFFTIPVDYEGNIVVNVLPGAGISKLYLNNGAMYVNGTIFSWNLARTYSDRIIWNFPSDDLTEITTTGQQILGSVLAPYADFTPNGGGVNGTLVAKSVTATGGWETHSTTEFGRTLYGPPTAGGISFTNTYKEGGTPPDEPGGPRMPDTGGDGLRMLMFAGLTMMALAGIALVVTRLCRPRFAFNTQTYSRRYVSRSGRRLTKPPGRRGRYDKRE